MKISIGTKNNAKVSALGKVLSRYDIFESCDIVSHGVESSVKDQPMSMNETINGAKNRAKNSYKMSSNCNYAFGIESGLMEVAESSLGYMEFTVCAIYDGAKYYLGFSPCFEVPDSIMKYVIEGYDLSEASNLSGYSDDPKLGSANGIVGILTKNRITRQDYTEDAIIMALIGIENN